MTEIEKTLREFGKDDVRYQLYKLESNGKSKVGQGATAIGDIFFFNHDDLVMVAIIRGYSEFLKTSPVIEILKQEPKFIEFKTESNSIYKLSK